MEAIKHNKSIYGDQVINKDVPVGCGAVKYCGNHSCCSWTFKFAAKPYRF